MLSFIRIAVFMGVVPFLVGMMYTRFVKEEKNNILLNVSAGYIIAFGSFELFALPMIRMGATLSSLVLLYGGFIIMISVASAILHWKRIIKAVSDAFYVVRHLSLSIWMWLAMVCLQIFIYIRYAYSDADDAFYIASANTSLATNTIFAVNPYTGAEYATLPSRYVLSPFHAFIAVLSKATGVHPAILAHSVMMIVFMLLAYAVYLLMARILLDKNLERIGFFMILLTALFVFSGYSERTSGLFFLIRLWQGKAIVAGVLLPFVLYLFLRLFFLEENRADWILLFFTMSACSMVSSMGIMLGAISVGIYGILLAVKKLKIRYLFYAGAACTVNIVCSLMYLLIR